MDVIKVLININNHNQGGSATAAAQATESMKHQSNDPKCSELGWVCVPYGGWNIWDRVNTPHLTKQMDSTSQILMQLPIYSCLHRRRHLTIYYFNNFNGLGDTHCWIINHVTDKLNFEMPYLYPHFEHSCMFDINSKILGFTMNLWYEFWREVKGLNNKSVYNRDFTNTV